MIRRCYPGGKSRAFSVTYDDGVLQDVPFVALLNRYGIKGTFNLNAALMEQEFVWQHECGMEVRRLPPQQVVGLYEGHEVASHTLTHPYMQNLGDEALAWEIGEDKRRLEALLGREVAGFAVPFDYYDARIAQCVERCGFAYGRMSVESDGYDPWEKKYFWRAGIFHLRPELEQFVEDFLRSDQELALCQIVGHSYDLDVAGLWDTMERIFSRVSRAKDVAFLTHIQLVRYLDAMGQAELVDNTISNPSDMELWFAVDGQIQSVPPGGKVTINC